MNAEAMLHVLEEHHRAIEAGLSEIRRHCGEMSPCSRELGAARERLTAASLARSRFVSEHVVPSLVKDADDDLRTELAELLYATAANRMLSNCHIKTWTVASIEADWSGYCAAARDIWPMMEDQMEHERRVLVPRLKQSAPGSDRQTKKGPA
jgi:imidazolonepropionase-like amidohydrolase